MSHSRLARRHRRRLSASIVFSFAIAASAVVYACNVPVFRFALERWRPDAYRLVLFHRGELSDAEREIIRPLDQQQDKLLANFSVQTVNLAIENSDSTESAADRALYASLGEPPLPWLVVQYPDHLRIPKPAWAGPLSRDFVAATIDSPIRRELTRRLAAGQTAVWLILEGGQSEKDDSAVALIEQQLKVLEQTLELPELTTSPDDALATSLPLKIEFSVLRVPRNVPAEHALVAMLIGSEPDLAERSDPMVFPVFGRGRALLPLIGAGVTEKNIHDAASFLAGPCSCEVKEQNPGFDLLLAADWQALLSESGVSLTAIETERTSVPTQAELVPIPTGASTPPPAAAAAAIPVVTAQAEVKVFALPGWILVGAAALGGLVILSLIVALSSTRQSARN